MQKIKPDIILLDIEMPEMSGTEAMQILKNSSDSSIPIIFLTADESAETKKEALELGAADYIPKPFSGEGLIQCIERALV
ncbi:hypothetical protein FACS1894102_7780 [Spirochaetia bacterium]|nr:hypothetical protein FACS1894102_7780 [Spirochaetia bacterium]